MDATISPAHVERIVIHLGSAYVVNPDTGLLVGFRGRECEAGPAIPGSSEVYWAIDEIVRQGVLYYLSEGEPNYIEIPETNNPNLESAGAS